MCLMRSGFTATPILEGLKTINFEVCAFTVTDCLDLINDADESLLKSQLIDFVNSFEVTFSNYNESCSTSQSFGDVRNAASISSNLFFSV